MKVRIRDQFQHNAVDVFLFERITEAIDEGTVGVVRTDGTIDFRDVKEKPMDQFSEVAITPTVRLPIPVVEELVSWYRRTYPTRHADDAIRDARNVRDRLLTLVEIDVLASREVSSIVALKELRK